MKGYFEVIQEGEVGAVLNPKTSSKSGKIVAVLGPDELREVLHHHKVQGELAHYQGESELLSDSIESRFPGFRSEGGILANAYRVVEEDGPEKILQFYSLPDHLIQH